MFPVLLAAILACGTSPTAEAPHADAPHADAPHADAPHADAPHADAPHAEEAGHSALVLTLDDGQKWQLDAHTRTVMGELRATLAGAEVAGPDDAAGLADTLSGQLDRLIAGCTMQGPAHDQLHLFLVAFMPAVEELRATSDPAAAQAKVAHLHGLVAGFDQHFE